MRKSPPILVERLRACLQEQYRITAITIDYLPLGLNYNAGVYRVESVDKGNRLSYLLKVKSGTLYKPSCLVPGYLKMQGIGTVVAPLPTKANTLWTQVDNWNLIVYPFIDGDSSWSGMTNEQWRDVGVTFKRIHQVPLPSTGFDSIRKEMFDPTAYVQWIRNFEAQRVNIQDPKNLSESQQALLSSWGMYENVIHEAMTLMKKLARVLQKTTLPYVICHADLHPANLIRTHSGHAFVIDWDDVMLAPKERDFHFVGEAPVEGSTPSSISPFFQGYGQTNIDWIALTYFRYERVIQDVIECTRHVFFRENATEETRADEARLFNEALTEGGEIDAAHAAAAHLPSNLM